jgi:hypothetical protein
MVAKRSSVIETKMMCKDIIGAIMGTVGMQVETLCCWPSLVLCHHTSDYYGIQQIFSAERISEINWVGIY